MFSHTWFTVIFLISTFAIRNSWQVIQVADWSAFQNILQSNKGPLVLLMSSSKNEAADTTALQSYCKDYPKCTCYQGIEETNNSFHQHFQNTELPLIAFYINGQEGTVLKTVDASKPTVTPAAINTAFQKICPSDGKTSDGSQNGGNSNGGNPPGGNSNGGNPPGGK